MTMPAQPAAPVLNKGPQPPLVRSGESVTGAPIRFIGKETFVKLAAGTHAAPISIFEDVSPPRHGPPLHKHEFEEFLYVLSGEFLFEVDGKQFQARPGDFVYAPPNIPHLFQNTSDRDARLLVVARPGGIEKYFAELAEKAMADPGNVGALNAIAPRYGITVLGPPMAARQK
jgi:quercetin dioxygenase-like cupin family protein